MCDIYEKYEAALIVAFDGVYHPGRQSVRLFCD